LYRDGNNADDGDTPLHKLFLFENYTRNNNDDDDDEELVEAIARVLIKADPLCVCMANKRGWLPLHTLCSNFFQAGHLMKPDFLKVLIEPYPESVIVENKGGVTPWEMLLSNFVYDLEDKRGTCRLDVAAIRAWYDHLNQYGQQLHGQHGPQPTWTRSVMNHHKYDSVIWACVLTMIEQSTTTTTTTTTCTIASKCDGRSYNNWNRPLHVLASSWLVDATLMEIGFMIHGSKSAMIQDEEEGNLPLHYACCYCCCCCCDDYHNEVHVVDENEKASKIQQLIMAYPYGTRVKNKRGYIPLFLAIETKSIVGWEDGMRDMVQAYPESLYEKDPKHFLYPFQLMASTMQGSGVSVLERKQRMMTCLYYLIRTCPELIVQS
jgi:hypothetical protein